MAHAQKTDFLFHRNGHVHLNRRGSQFSRLLAAEVCASALVMLDTPCSEVVWEYWLPTPFASFPFTSPPVCHRAPSGFKRTITYRFFQTEVSISAWPFFSHWSPTVSCHVCNNHKGKYTHSSDHIEQYKINSIMWHAVNTPTFQSDIYSTRIYQLQVASIWQSTSLRANNCRTPLQTPQSL